MLGPLDIERCPLPDGALLGKYLRQGTYTDCYAVNVRGAVSLVQYITAFYTTPVFKTERLILDLALSRPSTDAQAGRLAAGEANEFAAWHVEARTEDQLLLAEFSDRTRSWLMIATIGGGEGTRLYFGSAVLPVENSGTAELTLGPRFRVLLPFHKLYSRLLLFAARSRLEAGKF